MKIGKRKLLIGCGLLALFVLFTLLQKVVDVQPVGPYGTAIGFASLNCSVFELFGGFHRGLYVFTGVFGALAFAVAGGFALFGLSQLVHRKSFLKVDKDIYILAVFYILAIAAYVFFEIFVINYRPVDLGSGPEASYPSSHTMVVTCVLLAAVMQFKRRMKQETLRRASCAACNAIALITILGRLVSGAHWFTDILGGLLLAAALITLYSGAISLWEQSQS